MNIHSNAIRGMHAGEGGATRTLRRWLFANGINVLSNGCNVRRTILRIQQLFPSNPLFQSRLDFSRADDSERETFYSVSRSSSNVRTIFFVNLPSPLSSMFYDVRFHATRDPPIFQIRGRIVLIELEAGANRSRNPGSRKLAGR